MGASLYKLVNLKNCWLLGYISSEKRNIGYTNGYLVNNFLRDVTCCGIPWFFD